MGAINDAIFAQSSPQPTGTGVIHSFVRVQANGSATMEQGYNTDVRPVQFDEKTSAPFMRSIHVSELPMVTIDGVNYRVMLLDINQDSAHPQLSLDELRLYVSTSSKVSGYNPTTQQLGGLTAVYDMGANWIKLDASLSHGSGSGDMLALIPDSKLAVPGVADPYVYVYSKFGVNVAANGGFEEWAPKGSFLPLASIGGFVYVVDDNGNYVGLGGVKVTLDGVNNLGQSFTMTVTTNADGSYQFTGLLAGTYTIRETQPTAYQDGPDSLGTVNGAPDGTLGNDVFSNIVLNAGQIGINYNFTEFNTPPPPPNS